MCDIGDFATGDLILDQDGDYGIVVEIREPDENGEWHNGELNVMFFTDERLTIPSGGNSEICLDNIDSDYIDNIFDIEKLDALMKLKIPWLIQKYKEEIRQCLSH